MSEIGEFEIYQDVENEAAIIIYTDPSGESVIVGIWNILNLLRIIQQWNEILSGRNNHFAVRNKISAESSNREASEDRRTFSYDTQCNRWTGCV